MECHKITSADVMTSLCNDASTHSMVQVQW